MNLWYLTILWLLGWVLIIAIYALALIKYKKDTDGFWFESFAEKEIIGIGNNLFSTGFAYLIGNLVCKFINIPILHWLMLIIGILFCIPSIISCIFVIIPQAFRHCDKYITYMTITSFINAFTPLIMAINIYFRFIN